MDAYDSLREARNAFEREYIAVRFAENKWNVSKTADDLKIERSHLHRKIKLFERGISFGTLMPQSFTIERVVCRWMGPLPLGFHGHVRPGRIARRSGSRLPPATGIPITSSQPSRKFMKRHPIAFKAPCAVYEDCGGCQFQHVRYEAQLQYKQDMLEEAFSRIGRIEQAVLPRSRSFSVAL